MRQYYQEDQAILVEIDAAEQVFQELVGSEATRWYRIIGSLINIHLGQLHPETYRFKGEDVTEKISDYSLDISGRWTITNSGKEVLSDSDDGTLIDNFIEKTSLGVVTDTILIKDELSLFIEFSCGLTLQITPDKKAYSGLEWISLEVFSQYSLLLESDVTKKFKKIPIIWE